MKKFLVIYYMSEAAIKKMKQSKPEDHKKGMKEWFDWRDKHMKNIEDFGGPIGKAHKITAKSSKQQSNMIAGYSIIKAKDIDEANKLMKTNPHLFWADGVYLEVAEIMGM